MALPINVGAQSQARLVARMCWLLLLGHFNCAQAAEDGQTIESPDIELLEFLGSFQTEQGEWIEPESLLTGEFAELLNLAARMDAVTESAAEENDQDDNGQD